MNGTTLLIRADASSTIGVGHVMRCLALAQAWQDRGGKVVLVARELPYVLEARLRKENLGVLRIADEIGGLDDAGTTLRLAHEQEAAWVVLDGYRFGREFQETLREAGLRLLAIDDMAHQPHYAVDVLLNQNLSATPEFYAGKIETGVTELLLGPRFSLLRREFRSINPVRGLNHSPLRVLVTFGGADPENYTSRILENLTRGGHRELEVVVLAGAANPHVAELQWTAASAPYHCEVWVNVADVAGVMAWADVAIAAAGSTVWELASLQLPALVGAFEDNQLAGLTALRQMPLFRARTVTELLACDLGAELIQLAAASPSAPGFDALGASRVVDVLVTNAARPHAAALSA